MQIRIILALVYLGILFVLVELTSLTSNPLIGQDAEAIARTNDRILQGQAPLVPIRSQPLQQSTLTSATAASSSPNPCAQAESLGYSIRVGGHLYAVKKLTTSTGQIHVFFDEKGSPVEETVLLRKLASGAWARENIVASASTRSEIALKPSILTAMIGTSQDIETYTMLQDALVRGMTEAIEAWVTGGATLSTVVPHLTWSTIRSRLLNSPQTVLKLKAQVGLVESLKYYNTLSQMLPAANSTTLDISDLLNAKVLFGMAHGLDLPNEALAAALMPKDAGELIQQAMGSAISEILPSADLSDQVVTLKSLLDLDKSLAKTLPGLEVYNSNLNLVLNEAAANDRLIKQWATQASLACTPSGSSPPSPAAPTASGTTQPVILSKDLLLSRGFSLDDRPRPMCSIQGPDGPCQVEAFVWQESAPDPAAYTCSKLDRATYLGHCVDGYLQGVAVVFADGTTKAYRDAYLSYFSTGRMAYPALFSLLEGSPPLFGVIEKNLGYGCVSFGRWDDSKTRGWCPKFMAIYGSDIFSEANAKALREGTFDLSHYAAKFIKYVQGK